MRKFKIAGGIAGWVLGVIFAGAAAAAAEPPGTVDESRAAAAANGLWEARTLLAPPTPLTAAGPGEAKSMPAVAP